MPSHASWWPTLKIGYNGQFVHQGYDESWTAGCPIPVTEQIETRNYKAKYSESGELMQSAYSFTFDAFAESYSEGEGCSIINRLDYSKEILVELYDLYNELAKQLPEGQKLGFYLVTFPPPEISKIEPKTLNLAVTSSVELKAESIHNQCAPLSKLDSGNTNKRVRRQKK